MLHLDGETGQLVGPSMAKPATSMANNRRLCKSFQQPAEPVANWDAKHLARDVLGGLEGDVRVTSDTIVVTYYNAPNTDALRHHYEGLPGKLRAQGVKPEIPWLYDYKLDFRFR